MSDASVWTSTNEGMREYQRERLKLVVTETICKAMKHRGMNRKELARRLGISPGRVSQMLAGSNLTLGRVADMLTALGLMMAVDVTEISVEQAAQTPMYFIGECLASADAFLQPPENCDEIAVAA